MIAAVGAAAAANSRMANSSARDRSTCTIAIEIIVRKPRKAMPSHFSGLMWV
jgi:hypothetical protein